MKDYAVFALKVIVVLAVVKAVKSSLPASIQPYLP